MREGVQKREEKKLRERLVSYSVSTVSSDLQITLKNTIWFAEKFILNK